MLNKTSYIAGATDYRLLRDCYGIVHEMQKNRQNQQYKGFQQKPCKKPLKNKNHSYSMAAGIFLKINDIRTLNGVCYSQAWNIYDAIRKAQGKEPGKKITISEYAAFEMVDIKEVKEKLKIA